MLSLQAEGGVKNLRRAMDSRYGKKTATVQKDPSYLIDWLVSFVMNAHQYNFAPLNIVAMNETAVWNYMVSETTVEATSAKDVPMKSTGHEKVCFCLFGS